MAVDPLTAKILAKVAVQAATDSESRKRILFMILAPVLGLLLLIAFILYLINHKFLRTEPLTEEIDRMKSPEYSSGSVLKPNSFDILMRLFSNAIR